MSLCVFDDTLTCVYCGYVARKPRTHRQCGVTHPATAGEMLRGYARAVATWLAAGRPTRTDGEVDRLYAICQGCDRYDADRSACKLCGCRVSRSTWALSNKLRMATESCPVGKWGADELSRNPGQLRIGILTPNILVGGVESWMTSLVREWSRLGVLPIVGHVGGAASLDPLALSRVLRHCPVVTSADVAGCERVQSATLAAATVAAAVDVLVVWSISADILARCQGPRIVGVSHGCGDWWMRAADPYVGEWVAVHEVAATPCPRPATVIANGIDVERCDSTLTRDEARRRMGLPAAGKVAGYVGRFSPEKRTQAIADAAQHLPPDWSIVMVGRGRETPSVSGRAHIRDATEAIGDVWRACDVAIVASEHEGYCLSAIESLAAGVPLASTCVGAMATMPDEWFAAIEQPASPQAIAAAIVRAANQGPSAQAIAWARSQSAEWMARAWLRVIAATQTPTADPVAR